MDDCVALLRPLEATHGHDVLFLHNVAVAKYLAGDAREREQFPDFGDVEPVGAYTLRPGDVLYTPPFFWHHVRTHDEETAISVLVPFDMSPAEPIHVCHLY